MEMGMSDRLMAEFAGTVPIFAEGIAKAVNVGENVWVYLWNWGICPDTGEVCQMPAAILIRPRATLWSAQRVIEAASKRVMAAMTH